MQHPPCISVLVLAYNHRKYIKECIDSYLDSGYENLEILILDNGSTDDTVVFLQNLLIEEKYKIVRILPPLISCLSINASFNKLLNEAKGDLICFTSADDYTFPNRLREQVKYFIENAEIVACYSIPKFFEDVNGQRRFWDTPQLDQYIDTINLYKNNGLEFAKLYYTDSFPFYMISALCLQASMFKKVFVKSFNGFDEECLGDDIIFNFRLFNSLNNINQIIFLHEPLIGYRQHHDQIHKNFPRQSKLLVQAYEKYIPLEIKKCLLSKIYFFQVEVGFGVYSMQYFWLTTYYFIKSMGIKFNLQNVIRYFVLLLILTPFKILRLICKRFFIF